MDQNYLRIDNKYFAFRNTDFEVTNLISITIPKSSVEGITIFGKEVPYILHKRQLIFTCHKMHESLAQGLKY
jgi:hypothetical protein